MVHDPPKGVKGRKEKSDGSTDETNGRRLEASQFPRKFALLEGWCVGRGARYLSREKAPDGRREADGCWSDVFQRDSPARSSPLKSIFLNYTVISGVNRPD